MGDFTLTFRSGEEADAARTALLTSPLERKSAGLHLVRTAP